MHTRTITRQWLVVCGAIVALSSASSQQMTSPDSFDALSAAVNTLGSDILTQLPNTTAGAKGNFISPASVSFALGLLHAGATTGTPSHRQLEMLLGGAGVVGNGRRSLEGAQSAILQNISKGIDVNLANAVYVKPPSSFSPVYEQAVAKGFNATAQQLLSAHQVNAFVANATHGRIPSIVSQEIVADPATAALLVNAMYFKGTWQSKFNTASTASESFTALDGTTASVPTMVQMAKFQLLQDPRFTAIILPYTGRSFQAVAVLPAAGMPLGEAVAAASGKGLAYTLALVELHLPKFTLETQYELTPYLRALGLTAPFKASADLNGLLVPPPPPHGLLISNVLHKVFVKVDEAGTEAAAATAVGISTTAVEIPAPPVVLKFNRPFAFAVVHVPTQLSLFLGEVYSPA